MIDNKILTVEIVVSCLANLEPRISREMYQYKKWEHTISGECWKVNAKTLMDRRSLLKSVLVKHYQMDVIMVMVKAVKKDDVVSDRLCKRVTELVKSKEYQLEVPNKKNKQYAIDGNIKIQKGEFNVQQQTNI